MIQPIYLYGSEVLRRKAEPMDLGDTQAIKDLVQDLKDTLKHADGCGLAAPQIGVSKRVVIVDGSELTETYDYLKDFRRTLINPVITAVSEKQCEYNEWSSTSCPTSKATSSPTTSPPSAARCSPRSSRTSPTARSRPATTPSCASLNYIASIRTSTFPACPSSLMVS